MKGYQSETQQKNIAWFLPRPKLDRYKGGMPLYAEEWIFDLARDILGKEKIKILHLFCGMGKQGFKVDIKHDVNADLVCDVHFIDSYLPKKYKKEKFDVVFADPPYSNEESEQLYGTGKLKYSVWTGRSLKYLKEGGLFIIYHKLIMPNPNPEEFEVVKRVFIGNRTLHAPRVAVYFKKKCRKDELSVGDKNEI